MSAVFHPGVKPFRSLMGVEEASFASGNILSTTKESFVLFKLPVCSMS